MRLLTMNSFWGVSQTHRHRMKGECSLVASFFLTIILAGFALVGSFLAHVQVSARLIFSSCPAIYWFLSDRLLVNDCDKKAADIRKGSFWYPSAISPPLLIYTYFAFYNILVVIIHVNWLPWT
jgi:hypothetical protein